MIKVIYSSFLSDISDKLHDKSDNLEKMFDKSDISLKNKAVKKNRKNRKSGRERKKSP